MGESRGDLPARVTSTIKHTKDRWRPLAVVTGGLAAAALLLTAGCAAGADQAGQPPAAAPSTTAGSTPAPSGPAKEAPRTKPVPAPSGKGDVKKTVRVQAQPTLAPVPSNEPAEVKDTVRVQLLEMRRDSVKANAPGEISGPAVRVKVKITNLSGRAMDLDRSSVAVTDAAKAPLSPVLSDTSGKLGGALAPRASAEGSYLYSAADLRGPLSIAVTAAAGTPSAQFVGEPS